MIKKNTIFDFLTYSMVIWGISILSLCLLSVLFGEDAQGYSTIFELGDAGISISTLMQFLGLAFVNAGCRWIFFTDVLIKKLSIMLRSVFMFGCIILSVGISAAVFQWFPVNRVIPWIMFFVSFAVCSVIGVMVSVIKEKNENRKMQEALERLKQEQI